MPTDLRQVAEDLARLKEQVDALQIGLTPSGGGWEAEGGDGGSRSLVRAKKTTTNQSIPDDSSWTLVTFDTELVDRKANFASSIFTAPTTGYYRVQAHLMLNMSAGLSGVYSWRTGAATYNDYGGLAGASGTLQSLEVEDIVYLTAGDTVGFYLRSDVYGETLEVNADSPGTSWITVEGPI